MKSTIVSAWIESLEELYGEDLVNTGLDKYKIDRDIILKPTEDIEDELIFSFVAYMAQELGQPLEKLWKTLGINNAHIYARRYPALFKFENFYSFLRAMNNIHLMVTRKVSGAQPPSLNLELVGPNTAQLTYVSDRAMFDFFEGMLEGARQFFDEKVTIRLLERGSRHVRISMEFPYKILYEKHYPFNKFLSLTFIHSIRGKVLAFSGLLAGIPIALAANLLPNPISTIICVLLAALVPYFLVRKLMEPAQSINKSLNDIMELNFSRIKTIRTYDEFEKYYNKLNSIKDQVNRDFINYRSTNDELNIFTQRFTTTSQSMSLTSREIASSSDQLYKGIYKQADSIRLASDKLDSSIYSLSQIVEVENQGKENLERVVSNIEESFNNLKGTVASLDDILAAFNHVENKGRDLQNRADEVRNIIGTVSKIADQTNLLALNASIEASQAGDYGAGFSVVAKEIRELAENSKLAVSDINKNLESFIKDTDDFVDSTSRQLAILDRENRHLNMVAHENNKSLDDIDKVTDLLVSLTKELNKESKNLVSISDNINTLAQIAKDNSNYSADVRDNIQNYSLDIIQLSNNITEFERVSKEFSRDLAKYKL